MKEELWEFGTVAMAIGNRGRILGMGGAYTGVRK
jgi:hypothetical protein